MTEDVYDNLPEDNEQAFVVLEAHFREILTQELSNEESNYSIWMHRADYANRIIAAARSLDILFIKDFRPPPSSNRDDSDYFIELDRVVSNLLIQIKINHARRRKTFSVHLDAPEKKKIHFYITQIRDCVAKSNLDNPKKEAIFGKLSSLQTEVDRDRTRFEIIADATRRLAGMAGDFEKEGLRPYLKYILLLFGEVDAAKEAEQRQLPAPNERKQLEAPREAEETKSSRHRNGPDDDIPF
ncbi:hypothetical protein [Methylopila turkensis]|uniref:Uncharacterized protein n=1 Tax=Methylopila turkensis TaxID=1437816 RepID=A0A9W6JQL9_9HYPH|nr:hypothetical protein [Methylopila turkensis]GLK80628.1 hypothetical protein GCM10008174_23690 [Methylopila turkensis]